jgi:hypothetical protein
MIGLMFFGAIGLWFVFAIYLGRKLPTWLKLKPAWSWLFVPLVFLMPVIDEVIALPQAYALCKRAEDAFWYDPSAKGKTRMKEGAYLRNERIKVGLNIVAHVEEYGIKLAQTGAVVAKWTTVRFSPGFLNFPAGSSGGSMPLLLPWEPECPSRLTQWPKIDAMKKELQLTVEPDPSKF